MNSPVHQGSIYFTQWDPFVVNLLTVFVYTIFTVALIKKDSSYKAILKKHREKQQTEQTNNNNNKSSMNTSQMCETKLYDTFINYNTQPQQQQYKEMVESSVPEEPISTKKKISKDQIDKHAPQIPNNASVVFNYDEVQVKNTGGRSLFGKWWQYMKQANPLISSYRYYFRMQPRWTRAQYILVACQFNNLVYKIIVKYSGVNYYLIALIASIISYVLVLHSLYSFTLPRIIEPIKQSQNQSILLKSLKLVRIKTLKIHRFIFLLAWALTLLMLANPPFLNTQGINTEIIILPYLISSFMLLLGWDSIVCLVQAVLYKQGLLTASLKIADIKPQNPKTPVYYL